MTHKVTYLVQLVRGTDAAYDETCAPKVLLETTDKGEALALFGALPEWEELGNPEHDLAGDPYYWSPVVVEVAPGEGHRVIRE